MSVFKYPNKGLELVGWLETEWRAVVLNKGLKPPDSIRTFTLVCKQGIGILRKTTCVFSQTQDTYDICIKV